jgi:hypothetical protein
VTRRGSTGGGLDGPACPDGLIYVSSMVMLDSARRKVPVPGPARPGAVVAAWPTVALVGSQ